MSFLRRPHLCYQKPYRGGIKQRQFIDQSLVTAWPGASYLPSMGLRFLICKMAIRTGMMGFPGDSVVKNLPASAGDTDLIPGIGRFHCHGATKPMHHNSRACALEPESHNYWAHMLRLLKPKHHRAHALQQEKPLVWDTCTPQLENSPHSLQLEKSLCSNKDSAQPKTFFFKLKKKNSC